MPDSKHSMVKPKAIEEYIAAFPENVQQMLMQIRSIIKREAPGAAETIRYGMPAFKIGKEHIYLAAYKKHIGMYPMYGLNKIENELKAFRGKNTKDAIHFLYTKPIPYELIAKIIRLKMVENSV